MDSEMVHWWDQPIVEKVDKSRRLEKRMFNTACKKVTEKRKVMSIRTVGLADGSRVGLDVGSV